MKYLVDTSVWSIALRRTVADNEKIIGFLSELIDKSMAVLCGAVRQELLSGIKEHDQFKVLKSRLNYFEDLQALTQDYELAAQFYNTCRSHGIQGSNTDFLLCALAANHKLTLLTTDKDFLLFKKFIKFNLEYVKL